VADALDRLGPMLRGLGGTFLPGIVKGLLNEYIGKVPLPEITKRVARNQNLWDELAPDMRQKITNMGANVKLDFFTTDWAIDAITQEHPLTASLFLGWEPARTWLDNQITQIKAHIYAR
jgi:hypothetical protein